MPQPNRFSGSPLNNLIESTSHLNEMKSIEHLIKEKFKDTRKETLYKGNQVIIDGFLSNIEISKLKEFFQLEE